MAKKNFAQLAWEMASWTERDRFYSLEAGTKWVWFETVMTLDVIAGPPGEPEFCWSLLAAILNIEERVLQRHVDVLVSRGLLRRDGPGDISLPHELKISAAHRAAKIVVRRDPPKLAAVGAD